MDSYLLKKNKSALYIEKYFIKLKRNLAFFQNPVSKI